MGGGGGAVISCSCAGWGGTQNIFSDDVGRNWQIQYIPAPKLVSQNSRISFFTYVCVHCENPPLILQEVCTNDTNSVLKNY